jgi:hypothetical protein
MGSGLTATVRYDHLFDGVRKQLKSYELVLANLETVLSQASGPEENSLPPRAWGAIHLLSLAK